MESSVQENFLMAVARLIQDSVRIKQTAADSMSVPCFR